MERKRVRTMRSSALSIISVHARNGGPASRVHAPPCCCPRLPGVDRKQLRREHTRSLAVEGARPQLHLGPATSH